MTVPRRRAALVVAHPGHELRLHHWLERARPTVCVLTDGSGRSGPSRLGFTADLLGRLGAEAGPIFGRFSDLDAYDALLAGRTEPFVALALEIEAWLVE